MGWRPPVDWFRFRFASRFRRRTDGSWSRLTLGFAPAGSERPGIRRRIERIWSLHLICAGNRRVRLPDGTEHRLGPGMAVQFHADHHRCRFAPPTSDGLEAVLILDASTWRGCVAEGLLDPAVRRTVTDDLRPAVERFRALLERCERAQDDDWPLVEALAWVAQIARGGNGARSPAIAQACALLAEDLPARQPLAAVARAVGLGYEAFRKRFRAETGHAPADWRLDRRMAAACALLAGGATVSDVAARLGYADAFAFSDRFRERTGVRPAAWRRAHAR
jgi:AraC-like DNA-binding protein